MLEENQLVIFTEEVQIKRCFWEEVDRVATVVKVDGDGVWVKVHCIPSKTIKLSFDRLRVLPKAIPME